MMIVAKPSSLKGEVAIPASKSHTIRALLIAAMAEGESEIRNPLDSADTRSCADACRALGADTSLGEVWKVSGFGGKPISPEAPIDVGNSGTTLYLGLSVAALGDDWIEFTGDDQIKKRPSAPLLDALKRLGAQVESSGDAGLCPIRVKGPIRGGETSLPCPTSQYLSSLLLACPLGSGRSRIEAVGLNEKPYVEMTLAWLDKMRIRYTHEDLARFDIPGGQQYAAFDDTICGDFSSATFFLCAAALTGSDLTLLGLDMNDAQGDKKVVEMLKEMGAEVEAGPLSIRVRGGELRGRTFDLNDTPDALPAMAVTACFAKGETRLVNVPQARIKETDRIAVMRETIEALGGDATELPDGLVIRGGGLEGGQAPGHGDHRVVMALAIAGLAARNPVTVDTAEAVDITFPSFVDLMSGAGADMRRCD